MMGGAKGESFARGLGRFIGRPAQRIGPYLLSTIYDPRDQGKELRTWVWRFMGAPSWGSAFPGGSFTAFFATFFATFFAKATKVRKATKVGRTTAGFFFALLGDEGQTGGRRAEGGKVDG